MIVFNKQFITSFGKLHIGKEVIKGEDRKAMTIEKKLTQELKNLQIKDTQAWFAKLIQENQYVGKLYSIHYEDAKV